MTNENPFESSNSNNVPQSIIAIAVGNTRTRVGAMIDTECKKAQSFTSSDHEQIASYVHSLVDEFDFAGDPVILVSTVSAPCSDAIEKTIEDRFAWNCYRFGRDLQIPIRHTLTESGEQTVGQDRLLCAIGAFQVVKQACVVVDMGTAVTVDFIDGEGVFHGGAILPGINMMLKSLTDQTAHLPDLTYEKLDPTSFTPGRQTDDAMILGVTAAVQGAVRHLAERYAQFYDGYPQIIATGGDMGVLEHDEVIESFVPDLQLHGIRVACSMVIEADAEDQELDASE